MTKKLLAISYLLLAFCIAGFQPAFSQELERHEEPNGCCYAYIVCPTNLLNETIPADVHPWGQVVTVDEDGITNTVQKTVSEFVIFQRDNEDGTAVVKLSAKEGVFGRNKPVTVADLALWKAYLTPYGLTNWLTLAEYRTAYPEPGDEL